MFGGVVPAVAVGHGEPVITRVREGVEGLVGVRRVGVELGKEDGLFLRGEGWGRGEKTGDGRRTGDGDGGPGTGDGETGDRKKRVSDGGRVAGFRQGNGLRGGWGGGFPWKGGRRFAGFRNGGRRLGCCCPAGAFPPDTEVDAGGGQVLEMLLIEVFGVPGGIGGGAGFGFGPLAAEAGEEGVDGEFRVPSFEFRERRQGQVSRGRDFRRLDLALFRSSFFEQVYLIEMNCYFVLRGAILAANFALFSR